MEELDLELPGPVEHKVEPVAGMFECYKAGCMCLSC